MRNLTTLAVTILLIAGLPMLLTSATTGDDPGAIPASAFHDVELSVRQPASVSVTVVASPLAEPAPVVYEPLMSARPIPSLRPRLAQHVQAVRVVKAKPKATSMRATSSGHSVSVTATWYCKAGVSVCHYKYPDRAGVIDMYAAAGSRLRIGNWRGRVVRVCDSNSCITVKLVDWCGCPGIDLYWDAFHKLDPNNGGENSVRVSW